MTGATPVPAPAPAPAPGAGWRTAAGAVAAVVLGCGGCSSPSVDPAVSVDPIERLGRRAIQPAQSAGGGAPGAQGAPGAPVGERRAPARTPSVDPARSVAPAVSVDPDPSERPAPDARTARPSRTPALRAPVLAESATRLLDRIHDPQRPPVTPGPLPERHAPR
ncbi:hypothetical protein ACH4E8_04440 [Streptomyces sp. NPDC017979]|uniref:hypothetical protein n=1 Tax=Streptomyces sp. NPDC017979 TaxID=3365024 RepID=UPI00379BF7DE